VLSSFSDIHQLSEAEIDAIFSLCMCVNVINPILHVAMIIALMVMNNTISSIDTMRLTGIEPVRTAWKAAMLPLHHKRVIYIFISQLIYDYVYNYIV
jgi:hypothetical protein